MGDREKALVAAGNELNRLVGQYRALLDSVGAMEVSMICRDASRRWDFHRYHASIADLTGEKDKP